MPRPKRSKVAPSAPTALPHKFQEAVKSAIPAHVSSPTKSQQASTNSDDSDGLVTRKMTRMAKNGIARQEVQMSGALPPSSDGSATRRKPLHRSHKAELMKAARQRTPVSLVQDSQEPDGRGQPDAPEVQVPASKPEQDNARDETDQPLSPDAHSAGRRENVFASAMKRPQSRTGFNWRTQATPNGDTSTVSLANFKRRPRQPSLLGIGRPEDSPSLESLDDVASDDTLGTPSELSRSAQLDFTIHDDLSDFEPDNESTPFGASKGPLIPNSQPTLRASTSCLSTPEGSPVHVSSHKYAQHRSSPGSDFSAHFGKSFEDSALVQSQLASSSSRKRKITPPEVLVPQSQHTMAISDSGLESDHGILVNEEEDVGGNDAVTLEQVLGARHGVIQSQQPDDIDLPSPKRHATGAPEICSDTMAPPESSSPQHSQSMQLPRHVAPVNPAPTRGRGRPKRNQLPGPTKNSTVSKKEAKKEPLKPVSSATLQALIPRRRTKRTPGEHEIPSDGQDASSIDEDEDELSSMGSRRRKTGRNTTKTKIKRTGATKGKQSRATSATVASSAKAKAKAVKTYSRRVSNKENEENGTMSSNFDNSNDSLMPVNNARNNDSTDLSMQLPVSGQRELAKVAKKFQEVDRWEMEFEVITASSSSPKDAR